MIRPDKMVKNVKIHHVASFQIFLRDNKPKMNVYYPFLSQNQIMSKLRQQWKQLEFSKRQSYSKLVMTKNKTSRTIKFTRRRSPNSKNVKYGSFKKVDELVMKDNGYNTFDSMCEDSHITDYRSDESCSPGVNSFFTNSYRSDEFDSPNNNSPFMNNKYAIDNLNASFHSVKSKPSKSLQVHRLGKTYAGRVFELQQDVPKISSEMMVNNKNGILRTPCKYRQKVQSRVSFSTLERALNVKETCEFDDSDIDEEVLYVENMKTSSDFMRRSTNANISEKRLLHKVKSQVLEDHHAVHGHENTLTLEKELHTQDTQTPESKKRQIHTQRTHESSLVTSSERTPCRFSRRIKKLDPDSSPRAAVLRRNGSFSGESPSFTKKLNLHADVSDKRTFCKSNKRPLVTKQVLSPAAAHYPTRLKAESGISTRFKGQLLNKRITDIQDTVSSLDHNRGSGESLHQEHRLTARFPNKANIDKSTVSPDAAAHMVHSEAYQITTRSTANNLRMTPGRNKLLNLPEPPGTCVRSVKGHDNLSAQVYQTRNLRSSSKKLTKETAFEHHRTQHSMHLKDVDECEISQEVNESRTDFVKEADQSNDSHNEVDVTDSAYMKHSSTEKKNFYGINTNSNLQTNSRKPKTLERTSEGSTLKTYHKSEKLFCNKSDTRKNKTKCVNKSNFEKGVNLVQEEDMSPADTTEVTDSKPGEAESSSLRHYHQHLEKGDYRSEIIKYRNVKTNCKLNMPNGGDPESSSEAQCVPKLSVDSTSFHMENKQSHLQKMFKHLSDLYEHQQPISALPERDMDVKYYKFPEHEKRSTIMRHKPQRLHGERFDCNKSQVSREIDDAADPYLENNEIDDASFETDEDVKENKDDFLSHLTNQTTSALLQAIERLRSLSSPQINLTEKCLSDNLHSSDLSASISDDDDCVLVEKESVCHMFQDVTQDMNRTHFTPAKQRLLSSCAEKTSSNFMDMFDDQNIFF